MATVGWFPDPDNLRCPTCERRLELHGAEHVIMGRPDPVRQLDGATIRCPEGHNLPAGLDLYRWRDEHGYGAEGI